MSEDIAVRGEVIVQFWLQPGEVAVTLAPREEREVERNRSSCGGFCQGAINRIHPTFEATPP